MAFYEKGKWWVSPSNYADEVLEKFKFPKDVKFLDTTLRDGEQQASVVLSKKDKIEIAKRLDEIGVHRIEAGTPVVSKEDAEAIETISGLGLNAKVYAFVRNRKDDIKLAKELGVHGVVAEIIGSEHMLKGGLGWDLEKAIAAGAEATAYAHELGLEVIYFPADSSRASMDYLINFISGILNQGGHMDSLTLVDTMGTFSPEGAAYRVRKLIETFPNLPIEAHFHDDFGLGIASTIAALAAGASAAHVSISGIGERAGGASLETLAVALEALYGINTGIELSKLKELAEFTAKRTGLTIPKTKPIIGEEIFGWETGLPSSLWVNAKKEDPLIMLPYHWELVGQREPVLSLGKKSGRDNVKVWLKKYDLSIPEEKNDELLQMVKEKSINLKRVINENEFRELVAKINE